MKVLLDIKDNKVSFVMELLNSLNFVKVKPLSDDKAELMSNIKEAVDELNSIKEGKLKGIPAKDLLDEL
ncbi:hypothetical protein [Salibacter halophilus]|uniref:Uncharacterized protein n=1 Tax=Salibacter halophilus TaxID=1803916 RepID=A0A6N6M982_9FLAO|nr:hypothetical protein [Salibacter halophilus]KAB1065636.1 hypothetical protein F3059_02990 [Salibacter halophilus]